MNLAIVNALAEDAARRAQLVHNPDVGVVNCGSLYKFELYSAAAREWVDDNVDPDAQFLGRSLMVEPRYAGAIADGMQADGLVLH